MFRPFSPAVVAFLGAAGALFFTGCDKPQIRVYTADKDAPPGTPAPATAPGDTAAPERPPRPRPRLSYTLPPGWQEGAGNSLSLVNFLIKTEAGEASVNITPLAGMQGREAAIVNMWRAQVGQPALNDQDVTAGFTPVAVAGETGQLFEVAGMKDKASLRILTAFTHRGDESWFYKLQGSEPVVAAQKEAFLEFLKSVKIGEEESAAAGHASPPPGAPPTAVIAPEGWQTLPAGQMQVAKFAVATKDGAKAEVSVSVFPTDTGGTLANVNRWRRQLGLADVDEAGLSELVSPLGASEIDGAPGPVLADLTHENRRMLGAIVPREGRWWFYKMLGDSAAVDAERESFIHFVKSQP